MFSGLKNRIRQKISSRISDLDKRRMHNFPRARDRLVNLMIHKKMIPESKIKFYAILITFFGCGKVRHGPGTLASFMTLAIWLGTSMLFFHFPSISSLEETLFWVLIAVFLFIYGIVFIPLYEKHLNSHDHPSIVIDEVVGQIISLCLTYPFVKEYYFDNVNLLNQIIMLGHLVLSFVLFRFLDIAKPLFIGWIDRNVKGSFGVMLDDLACGLVAATVNISIFVAYDSTLLQLHKIM